MITRGHMYALAELARLAVKHKGDRAAIAADLQADKEWARFCARHGLPRNTDRPADVDADTIRLYDQLDTHFAWRDGQAPQ